MTALALSIGLFLAIAVILYGFGAYVVRLTESRYDRSSGSAESRRKHFR